jgi:GNAT superfamily N-acetyltransferase
MRHQIVRARARGWMRITVAGRLTPVHRSPSRARADELARFSATVRRTLGVRGEFATALVEYKAGPPIVMLIDLKVPMKMRGQGLGSRAVQALTDFADERGYRIALYPEHKQRARLVAYYERFGFKLEKAPDFLPGVMIREPRM